MNYIGEHTWAGDLGRLSVSIAFATALLSVLAYALSKKDSKWLKLGNIAFGTHAASIFVIVGTLFFMMGQHYFEYDYVWKHTSLDLAPKYLFSAFWEGQEGSFLLWMFWHAVLGIVLLFTAKEWKAPVIGVIAAVQAFLVSMVMGIYPFGLKIGQSPFVLIRELPENMNMPWAQMADYLERIPAFMDGSGLNPLLQNYWMTIHPPTLFLGFASTIIPFAFALGGLITKDYKGWIKPALPWTFFSVMILGTGILMGGAWAYEALSFGGFWAWDPVENSSLVPWLTIVAAAHLLLIEKNRGGVLPSAFFLSIISFLLVLYSTFLTRSGILGDSSVHAFVDLGMSGQLLLYLLFFIFLSIGLLIWRYKQIPKPQKEEGIDSREFWIFIASMVFLLSALQITISTSMPVFNNLFGPDGFISLYQNNKTIDKPIEHYNSFQVPFAIILTLLVGIGQFLSYKKTNGKQLIKKMIQSLIASVLLTVAMAWALRMSNPLYILLLFSSLYAVVANIDYWFRIAKGHKAVAGSSIAHIGFGLIVLGALISNGNQTIISQNRTFIHEQFDANKNLLIELNDTLQMGNYWVTWTGERQGDSTKNLGHYLFYDLEFYRENENKQLVFEFSLSPSIQMNERMGNVPEPDTRHFLNRDIYTHVTYADIRTEEEKNSAWRDELEFTLNKNEEILLYNKYLLVLDSVTAETHSEDGDLAFIALVASMSIKGIEDSTVFARPIYAIQNSQVTMLDAEIESLGLKIQFAGIDSEKNMPMFKVWRQLPEEAPFILIQAIVFPLINLLWAGCILMAIGTVIAVYQRVKNNKKKPAEA